MAWEWIGQIHALSIGNHSYMGSSFKVQDAVFCDDPFESGAPVGNITDLVGKTGDCAVLFVTIPPPCPSKQSSTAVN